MMTGSAQGMRMRAWMGEAAAIGGRTSDPIPQFR
jgi:hypothetical protein